MIKGHNKNKLERELQAREIEKARELKLQSLQEKAQVRAQYAFAAAAAAAGIDAGDGFVLQMLSEESGSAGSDYASALISTEVGAMGNGAGWERVRRPVSY